MKIIIEDCTVTIEGENEEEDAFLKIADEDMLVELNDKIIGENIDEVLYSKIKDIIRREHKRYCNFFDYNQDKLQIEVDYIKPYKS